MQYVIELRNHKTDVWNQDIIRRMAMTLFTEALLVFIAAMLPDIPSLILSLVAIAAGILLTFLGRKRSIGDPIAFVKEGDLIRIDISHRILAIVGVKEKEKTPEEIERILAERAEKRKPKKPRHQTGVLTLYRLLAASPMKGAYLDYENVSAANSEKYEGVSGGHIFLKPTWNHRSLLCICPK